MKNRIVLALAVAVLMAAPAFAAVQNVKVSGDIDSTYLNRQNFGLGNLVQKQETGLVQQSVFLTQTTLKVSADLSDNVSTTVGLINERAWDTEHSSASDTNVQLYLAYATLREFLYSPLSVTVGRQIFNYGNGLIIGAGGVNNATTSGVGLAGVAVDLTKRTSYDGIKAVLDYKPLTVDLIYFKNNQRLLTGDQASTKSSSDVYGLNANYQLGDAMNSVVEGYFFSRLNGSDNSSTPVDKGNKTYVPGLRVSTNPVKGLNTQAEVAWQLGSQTVGSGTSSASEKRRAMAFQVMASYAVPTASLEKYKPSVNASFTHVSGDKNAGVNQITDSVKSTKYYTAWDPLFESQGSGTIYNTLFNLTNLNILTIGGQMTPIQDVTASFAWSKLTADRKYRGDNVLTLLQPDGSSVTPTTSGNKDIGNEYDVNVNYNYTEDVLFGVNLGWFVPGKTFKAPNDKAASQAIAHVDVSF